MEKRREGTESEPMPVSVGVKMRSPCFGLADGVTVQTTACEKYAVVARSGSAGR